MRLEQSGKDLCGRMGGAQGDRHGASIAVGDRKADAARLRGSGAGVGVGYEKASGAQQLTQSCACRKQGANATERGRPGPPRLKHATARRPPGRSWPGRRAGVQKCPHASAEAPPSAARRKGSCPRAPAMPAAAGCAASRTRVFASNAGCAAASRVRAWRDSRWCRGRQSSPLLVAAAAGCAARIASSTSAGACT